MKNYFHMNLQQQLLKIFLIYQILGELSSNFLKRGQTISKPVCQRHP